MKKILVFTLTLCMVFSSWTARADNDRLTAALTETAKYVLSSAPEPAAGFAGGEWAVFGLARSGYTAPEEYYQKYLAAIEKYVISRGGLLTDNRFTEYARIVIALSAIGADPTDVGGYDLCLPLTKFDKMTGQGLNGAIWALIAMDCADYDCGEEIRGRYIDYILSRRLSDGGWELTGGRDVSDPDLTAMAVTALANYRGRDDVSDAADDAVSLLSGMQNVSGAYSSWGIENCESTAWVLTAAGALDIACDDERFIKNGNTLLDGLLGFQSDDGGFRHVKESAVNDQMATEQALYALASAKRTRDGMSSLFDPKDHVNVSPRREQNAETGLLVPEEIADGGGRFKDMIGHKNRIAVETLASYGIVKGKTEGLFDPETTMTRAEFAALVVRALGLPVVNEAHFGDVRDEDWFGEYVNTVYFYGIVNGVSETEFAPDKTLSRAEAAVMLSRAADMAGADTEYDSAAARDVLAAFTDYRSSPSWAASSLAFCYSEDILDKNDMEIRANDAALRGEIGQMIFNLLSIVPNRRMRG